VLDQVPPSDGGDGKSGDDKKAFGTLVKDKVQARMKSRVRFNHSRN
jgi:hypothetical protein